MLHPHAALYAKAVQRCEQRAKLAIVALGLTMIARLAMAGTHVWLLTVLEKARTDGWSDELRAQLEGVGEALSALEVGGPVLLIVTALLFLRWLHLAVKLTRQLGGRAVEWTPRQAVACFFVPLANFIQPYQLMRDVAAQMDPSRVAEPPPRLDPTAQRDYRTMAYVAAPPPKALPRLMIGLWWGTFVGMSLLALAARHVASPGDGIERFMVQYGLLVASSLMATASAGLAVQVVRSITARIEERLRRIGLSTPEELETQGITLEE